MNINHTLTPRNKKTGGKGEHSVHPRGLRDGHGSPGQARLPPAVWQRPQLPGRLPGPKQVSLIATPINISRQSNIKSNDLLSKVIC